MENMMIKISFVIYAITSLIYFSQFVFQKKILLKMAHRLSLLGFILQSAGVGIHFFNVGYPFLLQSADSYFFSAWILSGLFLLICLRYPLQLAGALFLPAILILYTLAHFTTENYLGSSGLLYSPWASVHIVLGFLSFSIFFLSFILGILFLFQEFQLKNKKIFSFFDRLPSLDLLDQMHYKALSVGFALLTLGMITGSAWAKAVKGVYFFDDPRQLWSIIAWLIYALFFQFRFSAGWRGRRAVLLSLLGFAVILFTFLEVRHV